MEMVDLIELIKKGKQTEYRYCRVCGRDIVVVQKQLADKKVKEYLFEHRKDKKINERDLESHRKFYSDRKHGKDCADCIHLSTTECKEIIRILRARIDLLESKRG